MGSLNVLLVVANFVTAGVKRPFFICDTVRPSCCLVMFSFQQNRLIIHEFRDSLANLTIRMNSLSSPGPFNTKPDATAINIRKHFDI